MDRVKDPDATKERYEGDTQERSWDANVKHTYDERAGLSVNALKQAQQELSQVNEVSLATLTNTQKLFETHFANMVNQINTSNNNLLTNLDNTQKQHTAHRDKATDELWNPVQQGAGDTLTARAVSIDDVSLKAIGAAVAAAIADTIIKK